LDRLSEMRRKDKEITERSSVSEVIKRCTVCRLGLAKNNLPYIVPVSFGYDGDAIYFHTAKQGKKIEYFEANDTVCFEFEYGVQLLRDQEGPCNWTFSFQSVIGYGKLRELTGEEEKIEALKQIVARYSDSQWDIDEGRLKNLRVWKIVIESLTGKRSKDKRETELP
jgi:nitroimidazol reductase NimA-like FMN-containing flavoprotein (pyridoxamine 5'-phosphate oxidase superfamily)